LTSLLPKIKK